MGRRMPPVSGLDTGPVEESSGGLKRSDCLCPVCLDIFLEPVTLPCMHTFCKPCFLQTVDKSNMCCPLCRKRVSTWARLNSRNKTLVNMELWKRIQDAFPTQCERRVQGIEDDDDAGSVSLIEAISAHFMFHLNAFYIDLNYLCNLFIQ